MYASTKVLTYLVGKYSTVPGNLCATVTVRKPLLPNEAMLIQQLYSGRPCYVDPSVEHTPSVTRLANGVVYLTLWCKCLPGGKTPLLGDPKILALGHIWLELLCPLIVFIWNWPKMPKQCLSIMLSVHISVAFTRSDMCMSFTASRKKIFPLSFRKQK